MALGKNFTFTADPTLAPASSFTRKEYNYLVSSGYTVTQGSGGFFNATKQ
jgi:hypothetical protein